MAGYTPNPSDPTQPTDAISAETAQAEFRALKGALIALMVAGGTRLPARQTVIVGPVDASGVSATIAASATALAVDLKATTSPQGLLLAFANGYNASGGIDAVQVISNDIVAYWPALAINNTSYLSADYVNGSVLTTTVNGPYAAGTTVITVANAVAIQLNTIVSLPMAAGGSFQSMVNAVNTGANTITLVTPVPVGQSVNGGVNVSGTIPYETQTLAPPQQGRQYDRSKQAVHQFGGAVNSVVFLDDFGNNWTAGGAAKVQTTQFKFGTGALGGGGAGNALDGAADFISTTDISTLGPDGWFIRGWVQPLNALPAGGVTNDIFAFQNAAHFGARLSIFNNGGTIKFTYNLSSTGAATDIATNVQGTTTPVLGTWYFVELTYDSLAGVYRLYVNGLQEASTASALKICTLTAALIGASNTPTFFKGYVDKFEFGPYCSHPNGTAYAVPTAAPNVVAVGYASDWFDTVNYQMNVVTGPSLVVSTSPALTQKYRLYIGEADTSGVAITAVRPYAIRGEYVGPWTTPLPAASTLVNFNHNMGTKNVDSDFEAECITSDNNYNPGDMVQFLGSSNGVVVLPVPMIVTRNILSSVNGSADFSTFNKTSGASFTPTLAKWKYRLISHRRF